MAKWLKDYLSFGGRRVPPQPPKPDYTESEILKAYRAQKNLDFEDPYEDSENRTRADPALADLQNQNHSQGCPGLGSPLKSASLDLKFVSPKHRLIKVDSQDMGRSKILLSAVSPDESPPSRTEPAVVPSAPAVGDTDYSDPFDARSETRGTGGWGEGQAEPPPENNGYMEPYEAQRVITELQRGPAGGTRTRGGVQLYDTPYEERERRRGGGQRGRGRRAEPGGGRESRLPQDDERPADEYDQPWEWKKDHISKAFAVQFDGAEWDRSSPPPDRLRPPRGSPLGGGSKLRRPTPDAHGLLGERVDPSLPLERQVWYHGSLSRSEAESLLTLCKECSYLVRNSETSHSDYSLSLRSCQGFMHMKFTLSKEGKYVLGQNSPPFDTIPEVIHFYTTHKLPIKGAEHLSLLFPVLVQTL
ncbi:SH2 domain-containing adapter protein D isoform X2 [Amia ocellicauda]|uniref:SH2 domain-containing adapter protein D isoform X2 n=1 Tax=Amia ocellicauda TaxID=2972642 RepID=UPI003464C08A